VGFGFGYWLLVAGCWLRLPQSIAIGFNLGCRLRPPYPPEAEKTGSFEGRYIGEVSLNLICFSDKNHNNS